MIRTAVVGVGYLGRLHAQKYKSLSGNKLVAVCDRDEKRAREVGAELEVESFSDFTQLSGKVDAVSIAVPTKLHFTVGSFFLKHNIAVLLEKPITATLEEAEELLAISRQKEVILQVGHLERFNPVMLELDRIINRPLFIDSYRLAPFNPRGADVNVILDLMIHDIDIIQSLVCSEIKSLSPVGIPVLTASVDISNTRIEFESGCVANVTASRISAKTGRKMRIFQHDAYIVADFQDKILTVNRKSSNDASLVESQTYSFSPQESDALKAEIKSFIDCINDNRTPLVSGEVGIRALTTAFAISDKMFIPKESAE